MAESVYLDCEEIKALRYKVFSTDFSNLSQYEVEVVGQLNSYFTEQLSLCTDVRRVTLSQEELDILSVILEEDLEIEDISDLKELKKM